MNACPDKERCTSSSEPVATIRLPLTATASTTGRAGSKVTISRAVYTATAEVSCAKEKVEKKPPKPTTTNLEILD